VGDMLLSVDSNPTAPLSVEEVLLRALSVPSSTLLCALVLEFYRMYFMSTPSYAQAHTCTYTLTRHSYKAGDKIDLRPATESCCTLNLSVSVEKTLIAGAKREHV
jgi:hypothetical protein